MTLTVIHRRPLTRHEIMAEAEEEILREGLGYYSVAEMRPAAIDLVNRYSENSLWVGCDCLPNGNIKPRLIPVKGRGFRRDLDPRHAQHSAECEFNQDPVAPTRVRASFQREPRLESNLGFRLARGFTEAIPGEVPPPRNNINRSTYRPGLARLLCELLTDAGVQEIGSEDYYPRKSRFDDMVASIKNAASNFEIAEGRYLNNWLAIGMQGLPELKKRIADERPQDWEGARPHGLLICNIQEVNGQELIINRKDRWSLSVLGRIAVFGEREATGRGPYLAICVVARQNSNSDQPEVLRAYVHPCLNWAKWTLVDSKLERQTVNLIQRCRFGLSKKNNVSLRITKPLFDRNRNEPAEGEPVCIPDFIIEILGVQRLPTVIVETMGYSDARYRNRKIRLREFFERIDMRNCGMNAYIVYHDPSACQTRVCGDTMFYNSFRESVRELVG